MESEATHNDLSPVSRTDFEGRSVREVCLQPRFRADWIGVCLFHPAGDKRIMVKQEGNGASVSGRSGCPGPVDGGTVQPISGDADRIAGFLAEEREGTEEVPYEQGV